MHGDEIVCLPMPGCMKLISSPAKFYKKLDKIKIGKHKYLTPSPIEDYLSFTYFDNWTDRTDRRHGNTFLEMHAGAMNDLNNKQEAIIWK